MFSFHWPELLIVVALAAILFPKRLPGIGQGLGKGIRGFRKSIREIDEQTGLSELKEMGRREVRDIKDLAKADLNPTASASEAAPPEEHRAR